MPWDQVLLMILFMYLTKFMCLCVGMSCMHDNDDYIAVRSQPAVQPSESGVGAAVCIQEVISAMIGIRSLQKLLVATHRRSRRLEGLLNKRKVYIIKKHMIHEHTK